MLIKLHQSPLPSHIGGPGQIDEFPAFLLHTDTYAKFGLDVLNVDLNVSQSHSLIHPVAPDFISNLPVYNLQLFNCILHWDTEFRIPDSW